MFPYHTGLLCSEILCEFVLTACMFSWHSDRGFSSILDTQGGSPMFRFCAAFGASITLLFAQQSTSQQAAAVPAVSKEQPSVAGPQRVSPEHSYSRILVIVPMIGSGKADDPKRPMGAPTPAQLRTMNRDGIIGMQYVLSDDGKFALVEFVTASPIALKPLLTASAAAGNKSFERGKNTVLDVEAEFQKLKKGFRLDQFPHALPH